MPTTTVENEKSLNEECGIFGIWNDQKAAELTFYGLHALQHRGQEGAGNGLTTAYFDGHYPSPVYDYQDSLAELAAANIVTFDPEP